MFRPWGAVSLPWGAVSLPWGAVSRPWSPVSRPWEAAAVNSHTADKVWPQEQAALSPRLKQLPLRPASSSPAAISKLVGKCINEFLQVHTGPDCGAGRLTIRPLPCSQLHAHPPPPPHPAHPPAPPTPSLPTRHIYEINFPLTKGKKGKRSGCRWSMDQ